MTNDDLAQLLLDLEHHDMTRDTDRLFQTACAALATAVTDDQLWARLQRAALDCHSCSTREVL